jgi:hypothetical protein
MRVSTRRLIKALDDEVQHDYFKMAPSHRKVAARALRWASATLDRGGSQPFGICKWFDKVEDAIKELGR